MDGRYRALLAGFRKWEKKCASDPAAGRKLWETWQKIWAELQKENVRTEEEATRRIGQPIEDCAGAVAAACLADQRYEDILALAREMKRLRWAEKSYIVDWRLSELQAYDGLGRAAEALPLCEEYLRALPASGELASQYLTLLQRAGDARLRGVADEWRKRLEEGDVGEVRLLRRTLAALYDEWGETETRDALRAVEKKWAANTLASFLGTDGEEEAPSGEELRRRGFALHGDQLQLPTGEDDALETEAPALSDENFASIVAKRLWNLLDEREQHRMLVDFRCSDCILMGELGYDRERIDALNGEETKAAMGRALEHFRGADGEIRVDPRYLTQLDDLCIDYRPAAVAGPMDGKETFVITGTCARCGGGVTRTYVGRQAKLLSGFAKLMGLIGLDEKLGRNDPCPCGSGKKYKDCCLKKQKTT